MSLACRRQQRGRCQQREPCEEVVERAAESDQPRAACKQRETEEQQNDGENPRRTATTNFSVHRNAPRPILVGQADVSGLARSRRPAGRSFIARGTRRVAAADKYFQKSRLTSAATVRCVYG